MRCRNKFGMTRNVILNSFQNPFSKFDIDSTFACLPKAGILTGKCPASPALWAGSFTFELSGVSNDG
jgi:hypothetical protein